MKNKKEDYRMKKSQKEIHVIKLFRHEKTR